jgi:ABC-2 type transport system ATP-binding protein
MSTAISVADLRKTYRGGVTALDGLSMDLRQGSILGLVGPNGAGKTTLISILAGLLDSDSGEVRISGNALARSDYAHRRQIGYVLDKPFFFEKLTPQEYLHFVAAMFGLEEEERERRTRDLIELFELDGKREAFAEALSKGMRQKLSLAAAIIHRPEILVLDEPLDGVDPESVDVMIQALREMNKRGVSVLLASHDLEMVGTLCDECAIIVQGKIVFQSSMDGLAQKLEELGASEGGAGDLRAAFRAVASSGKQKKSPDWM